MVVGLRRTAEVFNLRQDLPSSDGDRQFFGSLKTSEFSTSKGTKGDHEGAKEVILSALSDREVDFMAIGL